MRNNLPSDDDIRSLDPTWGTCFSEKKENKERPIFIKMLMFGGLVIICWITNYIIGSIF